METETDHVADSSLTPARLQELYGRIYLIRIFEERVLELFDEGRLFGTTHTCVGQEAIPVAVAGHLQEGDLVFSSHRCHGHYLARFGDPVPLLAELMGREGGVCRGRGGSQNLCRDGFFSAGVQGGYMPIVTGMAMAEKRKGTGRIVVAFIGDGTLGEGLVYESLNLASLWKVPLLVVLENNRYAQTTPVHLNLAGTMTARAEAFGVPASEIESNDIQVLYPRMAKAVAKVRAGGGPRMEIVHTYRLRAHSKGDDDRPSREIEAWLDRDPLLLAGREIEASRRRAIEEELRRVMQEAEKEVERMPPARLGAKETGGSPSGDGD